jgi:hypothetical protein
MKKVPHHVVDQLHSLLMDDDQFQEALMRVALEVAAGVTDNTEDQMNLAMELTTRVSVS